MDILCVGERNENTKTHWLIGLRLRGIDDNLRGRAVYVIWLGKDLSALIRLVLGGELAEYTEMMGSGAELLVYGTAVKFA